MGSTEEVRALQQELHELRDQAARAVEAERSARRSAEAASQLMRRKDEVRRVKQMKAEVTRAVEAEKEARRSAEAAVGLKRLIHDLGSGHLDGAAQLRAESQAVKIGCLDMSPAAMTAERGILAQSS